MSQPHALLGNDKLPPRVAGAMELIQDFGPSDPPGQAQTFGLTGAGSLNGGAKKRGRGSGGPKTLFANKINASQSPSSARPSPRPAAPAAKIPKKAARPAAPARPPAEARARDADCESQEAVLGLLDTLEEIDGAKKRRVREEALEEYSAAANAAVADMTPNFSIPAPPNESPLEHMMREALERSVREKQQKKAAAGDDDA